MHIETRTLQEAVGHLLVHNAVDGAGRKLLAKGHCLAESDVATLRAAGYRAVAVAVLAAEDVHEDAAAERIAAALLRDAQGVALRGTRGVGGRVNLHAEGDGLLRVDEARLRALNELAGVTLATRAQHCVVGPAQPSAQVATLKIIPYALPGATVEKGEQIAAGLLQVRPLPPQRIALLVTAEPEAAPRLLRQFAEPTRARLQRLGSALAAVESVAPDDAAIAEAAARLLAAHDALIVAGQTSIMDRNDTTPRALVSIGAQLALHGAPVEPGNLLALAWRDAQWLLCVPGCARSPAPNVVDLLLPRLLAGERLGQRDIAALALGGLL